MNLWFRLIWVRLTYRRRAALNLQSVAKRTFRIWPTDLDVFAHMNNGKFFSLLDVARYDWLHRAGIWQSLKKRNWFPIVVAENITFRKALLPWQKFNIESKIGGWDSEAIYVEQRFTMNGEICALAWVRLRFLVNPKGIVTPEQVIEHCGGWQGAEPELPAWVAASFQASLLPKLRDPAPSHWAS